MYMSVVESILLEFAQMEDLNFYEEVNIIFNNGINDQEGERRIYDENKKFLTANIAKFDNVRFKVEEIIAKYISDIELFKKTGHEKAHMIKCLNNIVKMTNISFETKMNEYLGAS